MTGLPVTKAEKHEALKMIAENYIHGGNTQKARFVKFGMLFWGNQQKAMDVSYVGDWIRRFNDGSEYIYADKERTKMLFEVDGRTNGKARLAQSYMDAGWSPKQIMEQFRVRGL